MRLKRYDRDADHSYTFGVFPTLELLAWQPGQAREVLLHSRGERSAGTEQVRDRCRRAGVPVEVNDRLVERLAPKENTYAVGVFAKYAPRLAPDRPQVVLVHPSDMGNLGTIIRTLRGFGVGDLALIRPAADIFDPRVVRASMGALFQLAFAYFDSFDAYRAAFPGHRLYPFMTDGATALPDARFEAPYALVFGGESSGLPPAYHQLGASVRIPQTNAVDSLNLAVAVGIALYAASQRRG